MCSFFHQLTNTINIVFIQGLLVKSGSFSTCFPIEHVFIISNIDEQHAAIFLDLKIPRIIGLAWSHQSWSSSVGSKNLSSSILSNSLHDGIGDCRNFEGVATEFRQFFSFISPNAFEHLVVSMNGTSWSGIRLRHNLNVRQFVKVLLAKLFNDFPLRFDFIWRFTQATTLPESTSIRVVMVSSSNLRSPLLSFFSLLRTSEILFDILTIFLSNDFLLTHLLSLLLVFVMGSTLTSSVFLLLAFSFNLCETHVISSHHSFNWLFVCLGHCSGSSLFACLGPVLRRMRICVWGLLVCGCCSGLREV